MKFEHGNLTMTLAEAVDEGPLAHVLAIHIPTVDADGSGEVKPTPVYLVGLVTRDTDDPEHPLIGYYFAAINRKVFETKEESIEDHDAVSTDWAQRTAHNNGCGNCSLFGTLGKMLEVHGGDLLPAPHIVRDTSIYKKPVVRTLITPSTPLEA